MLRAAILASLLAGCSSILGIGDVTLGGDGGTGDAPPPPNTVIGRSFNHCITELGTVDHPADVSIVIIAALLPDATQPTGFRTVNGSGKADGTFRIDDVPDGVEYVLKIGRAYFVTKAHSIDHHFEEPARCDAKPVTSTTKVAFSLTGMTAFANAANAVPNLPNDAIEVDSFRAGYQGSVGAVPLNSSTTLSSSYDWGMEGFGFTSTSAPLLDAAAMDDLLVLHTRSEPVGGSAGRKHQLTHIIDLFQTTSVSLADGMSTSVSGAFTPVPLTKSVNFSIARGGFDTLYDGTSQRNGLAVTLLAHPYFNDFQVGGTLGSVGFDDWARSPSLNETVGFMYGDPFPTSWTRYLAVTYSRFRFVLLPGTTVPRPVFGFYQRELPFTGGLLNLTPTLATPSSVKVAGNDFTAGGKVAFDGMKPVAVTWNGVAGAKTYTLQVTRMFANGNQTKSASAATLVTANTSIDVPAEVFSGGEFFAFTLTANQSPYDYTSGQMIANGTPNQFSPLPSGMFRMSSKCGNGVVDPGEECDTMGESASCDIDCTLPKCGDGLRNAAAGEACDTVRPTAGCNLNCTLPKCGDNIVNTDADEDCDDGNTTDDGNGCTATCKLNGVCGNSKVEIGEACDTGGVDTGTCNGATCTTSVCGDGHLNTAAGEQCDDGNLDDGDGCSSTCKKI
jgi:cysteine-rich repeat protein